MARYQATNEVVRVVLLGKTGSGKSSLGNLLANIVGTQQMFAISGGLASETRYCDWRCGQRGNVRMEVTDTPGLCDTHLPEEVVYKEVGKSVAVSTPGPHVLVLVFRADRRFTKEEYQAYQTIKTMFSGEMDQFLLVVFVGIDALLDPDSTLEQQRTALRSEIAKFSRDPNNQKLAQIINDADGRYFGINNARNTSSALKEKQIVDLIGMMLRLKAQNNHQYYDSFLNAEIRRRVDELANEYARVRRVEPEEVMQEVKQDIVEEKVNPGFFQKVGAFVKKAAGKIKDACVVM